MQLNLALVVLCLFAALMFGGVRLLLAGKVSAFWLDVLSFGLGAFVLLSQTILGYKI